VTALHQIDLSSACAVALHRTLRIPDDGRHHPLPPSLGHLPVYRTGTDEYVVPMRRAEAMWLGFRAPHFRPHALKVGIGGVDAVSGLPFTAGRLTRRPQDYVVVPDQPWLDGINAGAGVIRQFVAVPLGEGLTVEAQLTGTESDGGLTLSLFEPRPGRFPDAPPPVDVLRAAAPACAAAGAMGLGAGGRMRQEIYEDEYGVATWRLDPARTVRVELVDALAFEALTGIAVPGPPVDARTYTQHGLPWFDLLEPGRRDLAAAERLAAVRSIADLERRTEDPLPIPEGQVRRLLRLRTHAEPVA
jgi:hypothetical protein